jgi:hypothetical protein
MVRKLLALSATVLLGVAVMVPAFAEDVQKATKKEGADKQNRVEGVVTRSYKDKSMLTVRDQISNVERNVYYDSSTDWSSKEHRSKNVNEISADDVKDGDRVICLGSYDDKGQFHATSVSKRLTQR